MRLGINDLSSLEWQNRLAFEDLEVQVQAGWKVNHADTGKHTDIDCDSLEARSLSYIDLHSGIRMGDGPFLIDDPALGGSLRHQAMLRWDPTTGTYNNVSINGITTAIGMEIEPQSGNVTLTGMQPYGPSLQKQFFYLRNRDSSLSVILKHENANSLYNYRFDLPGGVDVTMGPGESFDLYYDPARERWTAKITGTQTGGIMPGTGVASVLDAQLEITIDGNGAVITTGAKKVYGRVPWDFTPTAVELVADQSGSIVIDLWKDTYANFPPTVADTVTASAKPTLSAAQKSQDTTLTGWTTTWSAGDRIEVNVDSATTVTKVVLTVYGTRSS